jgi:hypothetical protein
MGCFGDFMDKRAKAPIEDFLMLIFDQKLENGYKI